MIEPEMAFHDNFDNMDVIEQFLRAVVIDVLATNQAELELIGRDTSLLQNIVKVNSCHIDTRYYDFPII